MSEPYLTVVMVTRNDDHDPDLKRLHICLQAMMARLTMPAELIIVEWNPPQDRPRLVDAVRWPEASNWTVRIVEVSPEAHRAFAWTNALNLYVLPGRNVGIRRARGKFVLPMNQDCLFSSGMVNWLNRQSLSKFTFYRVDRCDVPATIPYPTTVDQYLEFCRENTYARHGQQGKDLHTNASGDFMLMSRAAWISLRGYLEIPFYGLHLDSWTVYQAAYEAGLRQVVLEGDAVLYHIDHEHTWPRISERILAQEGIPFLPYRIALRCRERMAGGKQALEENAPDWGWANEDLSETMVKVKRNMKVVVSERGDIPGWLVLAEEILPLFGPVDMPAFEKTIAECVESGMAFCIREGAGPGLVGGLIFKADPPYAVEWLGVAERHRRRGAGTLLVERALSLVVPPAVIEVKTFGPGLEVGIPARGLYEKMGFSPAEMVPDCPEDDPRQVFRRVLERKERS